MRKSKDAQMKSVLLPATLLFALMYAGFVFAAGGTFDIEVSQATGPPQDEILVLLRQINSTTQDINSTVHLIQDDLSDALSNLTWIIDNVATQQNVTTILTELSSVNTSLDARFDNADSTLAIMNTTLNAIDITGLQDTLAVMNGTLNNVDTTTTETNLELEALNTTIQNIQTVVTNVETGIAIMNTTINTIDTTTQNIETGIAIMNTTVNSIQTDTTNIYTDTQFIRDNMATLNNMSVLFNDIVQIQSNLTDMNITLGEIQDSISALGDNSDVLTALDTLNQTIQSNFTTVLSTLTTEFNHVENNFTQVFTEFNNLQTNLTTIINNIDTINNLFDGAFGRTNQSAVIQEDLVNVILTGSTTIQINYTINVPPKSGYNTSDYLPIKIHYWFIDENNQCISQHEYRSVNVHCEPLVAEGLGQVEQNTTFLVELQPSLDTGNYTVFRELQIDPPLADQPVWKTYGSGVITEVEVTESTLSLEDAQAQMQALQAKDELTDDEKNFLEWLMEYVRRLLTGGN